MTERLEQAEKDKIQIIADARIEEEKIIRQGVEKAEEQVRSKEEEEKRAADEKIGVFKKNADDKIAAMGRIYKENHEAWADEIMSVLTK